MWLARLRGASAPVGGALRILHPACLCDDGLQVLGLVLTRPDELLHVFRNRGHVLQSSLVGAHHARESVCLRGDRQTERGGFRNRFLEFAETVICLIEDLTDHLDESARALRLLRKTCTVFLCLVKDLLHDLDEFARTFHLLRKTGTVRICLVGDLMDDLDEFARALRLSPKDRTLFACVLAGVDNLLVGLFETLDVLRQRRADIFESADHFLRPLQERCQMFDNPIGSHSLLLQFFQAFLGVRIDIRPSGRGHPGMGKSGFRARRNRRMRGRRNGRSGRPGKRRLMQSRLW